MVIFMIYLDYSATTKVSDSVLNRLVDVSKGYFANPNSMHALGVSSKKVIDDTISVITGLLGVGSNEFIFTSGASESNNTVLKGVNVSHIITTKLEHSSITTPCGYLQTKGKKVSFVKLLDNGLIDMDNLKEIITDDRTLVSIGFVNSETGLCQNIDEIGKFLKKYPNVIFHSDITQALGKVPVSLENVDLASFSFHKIFGFKGIGGLVIKNNIRLVPLIHGGKAISVYRSGTPQTGLIASSGVALSDVLCNFDSKYDYVLNLNKYLVSNLRNIDGVVINSNDRCIPHIVNFSISLKNSDDTLKYFSDNDIYISSRTACSSGSYSLVINELYNDMDRASNSVRVSISYKTTIEELDVFINKLKEWVKCK